MESLSPFLDFMGQSSTLFLTPIWSLVIFFSSPITIMEVVVNMTKACTRIFILYISMRNCKLKASPSVVLVLYIWQTTAVVDKPEMGYRLWQPIGTLHCRIVQYHTSQYILINKSLLWNTHYFSNRKILLSSYPFVNQYTFCFENFKDEDSSGLWFSKAWITQLISHDKIDL